jgi:hypothetical protein
LLRRELTQNLQTGNRPHLIWTRFNQRLEQLVERGIDALAYFFSFHSADGMAHDYNRRVGRIESFPLRFSERFERMRDYRNRGFAALLNLY